MKNAQHILLLFLLTVANVHANHNHYARSIFVPRQLSYNPILENALMLDTKTNDPWDCIFSIKPIYTQSVGSKFKEYFMPCHKSCLNVQEDGSGDISSLWFSVVSSNDTFYSSRLSFSPKRQTYGALLYAAIACGCDVQISLMTAVVQARNTVNLCESGVKNLGTCPGYATIAQSFANCDRRFGRVCGTHTKTGVDDIQIKVIYNPCKNYCFYWDVYGLLGIPTGKGSKAVNLFEPLVGSKHVQLGFGTDMLWNMMETECGTWSLLSEVKYRYGFAGKECRSFDLQRNCQWSRYMLFVDEADPYTFFPAINNLTFKAKVTPQSSVDLYLATHFNHNAWNFELGYDLWYRSAEKITICSNRCFPDVGIADLRGIAFQNPHTASTANISQGIEPGINQMTSDPTFVPVTLSDIACFSGAQARSLSNSFYGSIAYTWDVNCHPVQVGINVAYEQGSLNKTPNNVTTWLNVDLYF